MKIEMASRQHELDQFSGKGKQLVIELKKIPDCDSQMIKKNMDTLVDHWLDVSHMAPGQICILLPRCPTNCGV